MSESRTESSREQQLAAAGWTVVTAGWHISPDTDTSPDNSTDSDTGTDADASTGAASVDVSGSGAEPSPVEPDQEPAPPVAPQPQPKLKQPKRWSRPDVAAGAVIVDRIRAIEVEKARLEASMLDALVELLAWTEPDEAWDLDALDLAAAELGPVARVATQTATLRIVRARRLLTALPGTVGLLRAGRICASRAAVIESLTTHLSEDEAALIESMVLPGAPEQTPGEFRRAVERHLVVLGPEVAERRRRRAIKARSVQRWAERDGTGVVRAHLSRADAEDVYDLLTFLANDTKLGPDDPRSMDERRADAFVAALVEPVKFSV